jgi:putrescine aminotransferase
MPVRTRARTRRQTLSELKSAHHHPTYSTMSFIMGCGVQGEGAGSAVLDENGESYLALFDQYGNQSFGYSHPRLISAVREQLDSGVLNSTKIMFEEVQIRLSRRISELTGGRLPFSYLANGGGESIDNALKLARAATRRPKFITATDCFHGKTLGTLSASGRPEHLALFQPLLGHFHQVPFGDLDALAAVLDTDTAAVLLEPVQAEGGVIVPSAAYLQEVRRLCTEAGALLILDEMQTAFGRCGTFFAFDQFGVTPDLACIGKAFGGGMVPISAVIGTAAVWECLVETPSTFGSSLGGNPLSCRVGLESIAIASDEEFLAGVREKGAVIESRLAALAARFPELISAHRGIGMMHGLEFSDESLGGLVLRLLLERWVTSTYSLYNNRVLRVQPPMVISPDDLARGLDVLDDVVKTAEKHRTGARGSILPPVTMTIPVSGDAADVLALLRAQPRLLDPFAADNAAGSEDGPAEFEGTLGDDVVIWTDSAFWTDTTLTLRAEPSWLWTTLDREFKVRTGGDGAEIDVRIDWDAGTGEYEGMLAGRLSYYVTGRLAALGRDLQARLTAPRPSPPRPNPQTQSTV